MKIFISYSHQDKAFANKLSESLNTAGFETWIDAQLGKIKSEYIGGNLTLFCGAGISMDAGIPPWPLLLKSLLSDLFQKQTVANTRLKTAGLQEKLAELYQKYFNPSPLMIAQY